MMPTLHLSQEAESGLELLQLHIALRSRSVHDLTMNEECSEAQVKRSFLENAFSSCLSSPMGR